MITMCKVAVVNGWEMRHAFVTQTNLTASSLSTACNLANTHLDIIKYRFPAQQVLCDGIGIAAINHTRTIPGMQE